MESTGNYKLVMYDMTNVDPDDRESINHKLNDLYFKNALDKNNPLESFLIVHIKETEEPEITKLLTSNYKFQSIDESSEQYKNLRESLSTSSQGVGALIDNVNQVIDTTARSATTPTAVMTIAPLAPEIQQETQVLAQPIMATTPPANTMDSINNSIMQLTASKDYAAEVGLSKIVIKSYNELAPDYTVLIDRLNVDRRTKDMIKNYAAILDAKQLFTPGEDLFVEINSIKGNLVKDPKDNLTSIAKALKDKHKELYKTLSKIVEETQKLAEKKYRFFTVRESSKINEIDTIGQSIKRVMQEPTGVQLQDKDNLRQLIYNLRDAGRKYFARMIIFFITRYMEQNKENVDFLMQNGFGETNTKTMNYVYDTLFKDANAMKKSTFLGMGSSIDSKAMDVVNEYSSTIDIYVTIIKTLVRHYNELYDRYNKLYTYINNLKTQKEMLKLDTSIGGRRKSIRKSRRGSRKSRSRSIRHIEIPYRERLYRARITSDTNNKRKK